jgi:hypothetical protein
MLLPNFSRYRSLTRGIVLRGESRRHFLRMLDPHHEFFEPANFWESEIVEGIVANTWRIYRIRFFEAAMINRDMQDYSPMFQCARGVTKAALAMRTSIGQSRILEILQRFENRYSRNAVGAFRLLLEVRAHKSSKNTSPETKQ